MTVTVAVLEQLVEDIPLFVTVVVVIIQDPQSVIWLTVALGLVVIQVGMLRLLGGIEVVVALGVVKVVERIVVVEVSEEGVTDTVAVTVTIIIGPVTVVVVV